MWFKCVCGGAFTYMCVNECPSAQGYIALKILLIISSPSSVSLRLPLSFILSFSSSSRAVCICYISAIALGSLGETVRRVFHGEKNTDWERLGKQRGGFYWQKELSIMKSSVFSYSMAFGDNTLCLPVNISHNGAFRYLYLISKQ